MATLIETGNGRGFTVVFQGRQGPTGNAGVAGPVGPQGRSIAVKGAWVNGTVYAAGDAVSADSTAAQGITSLFVQRDGTVTAISTTEPRDDPARWMEVGATDLNNVTGAIWTVTQAAHGFTQIGTPVGHNGGSNRWVETSNLLSDEPAVAVVRDIPNSDQVVLQTTGQIDNLDPTIIVPPAADFLTGALYYVGDGRGTLTLTKPSESNAQSVNAVLLATGPDTGVVLQWQAVPNIVGRRPVGYTSFFYIATAAQTVFTGADLNANVLAYAVSDQTRVLVDGLDLFSYDEFTAATGTSVTVASAMTGGEKVEIRVLAEPLEIISAGTSVLADPISGLFDGVQTIFPLTTNSGDEIALTPSPNVIIWLDGSAQEPFSDYVITSDGGTGSEITFTEPPPPGTRFWALVGVAISGP